MTPGPTDHLPGGFRTIHLPEPPPWQPDAPGWWALLALVLVCAGFQAYRRVQRWRANRYRRHVLDLLRQADSSDVSGLASLIPAAIKFTALQAYPRKEVASLTGKAWLEFLDSTYDGPSFQSAAGKYLLDLSYRESCTPAVRTEEIQQLLAMSRQWIKTHKTKERPR